MSPLLTTLKIDTNREWTLAPLHSLHFARLIKGMMFEGLQKGSTGVSGFLYTSRLMLVGVTDFGFWIF